MINKNIHICEECDECISEYVCVASKDKDGNYIQINKVKVCPLYKW